jgi:hypothetical protein
MKKSILMVGFVLVGFAAAEAQTATGGLMQVNDEHLVSRADLDSGTPVFQMPPIACPLP